VRVAEQFGVSPLLIGLTLVGFGTSTPELVTSVQAALVDSPGIAVGNIVGSNIANILLILGLSALVHPMAVQSNALKRDGLIMVASAVLLALVSLSVGLQRWVGVLFVLALGAYIVHAYRQERVAVNDHSSAFQRAEATEGVDPALRPHTPESRGIAAIALPLMLALGGLAIIIFGGRFLVDGAVQFARGVGISETVIGLTIVAVGTSMPEFVTSIVAAFRRQVDVAFGNILGSNIYNVLGIGGVTALIAPTQVPAQIANLDNWVMVGASLLLLLFAFTGRRLGRAEAGVFVALYACYTAWLIMST
jgi:cation:H+ antiporter